MIETKIINKFPIIVHHRVTGSMSENGAMVGAIDALSVVKQVVGMGERLHIILDMRGYVFENLESHKIWTTEFRQHQLISENVDSVTVVGDAGPKLFAEKEMMETDVLKFFSDFNSTYEWLRNPDNGSINMAT